MGVLAHTDRATLDRRAGDEADRVKRTPARRNQVTRQRETSWNVLAEELLSFPPADRALLAGAALRAEPADATRSSVRATVARHPSRASSPCRSLAQPEPTAARIVPLPRSAVATEDREDRTAVVRSPHVAPRSRGLRRLLPGAATLAVLTSVWFGAGALSSLRHPTLTVIPGSVKVPGGYRYLARPGDTLWSIASRLQPGADPRPLVARLEQQLHGAHLVAGDRLVLP
jgi:hypothetical protein